MPASALPVSNWSPEPPTGRFADRTRAYWPIVFIGYGVNVLVVPAPLHVQGCSVALDAVAYVLHDGMQTE